MKNKFRFIITLLLLQISQQLLAQDTTVIATAKYEMTYLIDTTMPESPLKQEMVLLLGKQATLFRSVSDINMDVRLKVFYSKNNYRIEDSKLTLFYGEASAFFIRKPDAKMVSYTLLGGISYQVEESMPVLKWDIKNEIKSIGGYPCQKAITQFKGRSYEAWFCSQLPFNAGPWKLNGLPGLILEAADSEKQWVMRFISFEEGGGAVPAGVRIPDIGYTVKKINQTDLSQLLKAYRTDPNGFLGVAPNAGMMAQASPGGTPPKRKTFNNPLEKKQ